jgi:hypothetical protein
MTRAENAEDIDLQRVGDLKRIYGGHLLPAC